MRAPVKTLAAVLAAMSASACVSLLPKSDPAVLYRFDVDPVGGEAQAPANQVGLLKPPARFPQASAGDRILTVTGGQAAYIAAARWVAPASVLFDEAVARGFDGNPGAARLVTRGEVARADMALRLDVRTFETVYDSGPEAAPQVVIRVRAALTRANDRSLVGERMFEQTVRAGDNRVGAIVAAYDQAVTTIVRDLVAWTNQAAAG
ncbi:ABC-type transport auxiliary lipoprotein family protein [Phenylobacterium terrae]|uniref:ABC-type transport auxiliary lipoprotein family protein n=1 Tax=Phenylobacterium terrae TaxID=2665495 RepID=A0ABW4MVK2_9CAUL